MTLYFMCHLPNVLSKTWLDLLMQLNEDPDPERHLMENKTEQLYERLSHLDSLQITGNEHKM